MEYLDSPHVQPAPTDQELQVSSWEGPVAGSLLGWCHRQHLARQGHPGSGPKSEFQWKMWYVRYVRYVIHVCLNIRWTWKSAGKSPGEWNVGICPSSMAISRGIPWYIIRYIPFSDRAMWCLVDGRLNMQNHQRLCDHMWSARGSSGCLRDGLRDGSHMKKYRLLIRD